MVHWKFSSGVSGKSSKPRRSRDGSCCLSHGNNRPCMHCRMLLHKFQWDIYTPEEEWKVRPFSSISQHTVIIPSFVLGPGWPWTQETHLPLLGLKLCATTPGSCVPISNPKGGTYSMVLKTWTLTWTFYNSLSPDLKLTILFYIFIHRNQRHRVILRHVNRCIVNINICDNYMILRRQTGWPIKALGNLAL